MFKIIRSKKHYKVYAIYTVSIISNHLELISFKRRAKVEIVEAATKKAAIKEIKNEIDQLRTRMNVIEIELITAEKIKDLKRNTPTQESSAKNGQSK